MVLNRVKETQRSEGVEIIGLVVSQAHDNYEMYVLPAASHLIQGPFLFVCDRVAKALQKTKAGGRLEVMSAQRLEHIDQPMMKKNAVVAPAKVFPLLEYSAGVATGAAVVVGAAAMLGHF